MSQFTHNEVPARRKTNLHRFLFIAAGLVAMLLYATHFVYCERSPLKFMDEVFVDSDMHANLLWAKGIGEQGWLNPRPYHPWTSWMQAIAPYSQWVQWWGGEQIFQQSPLYAYLLSVFQQKLLVMRILQQFVSLGTCLFIGLFTYRIGGRLAGWIAFWIAALYAPFYVHSWPFLRDGLAWFITAALLWALSEMTDAPWPSARATRFAGLAGVLLGLGFLTRETYLLVIPVVLLALLGIARRQHWGMVVRVAIALVLTISPLMIRNLAVKAPLLSTSTRFVETMIVGNAGSSEVYDVVYPAYMGQILYQTRARPLPAILATIATHPDGFRGWIRLELLKLLSLFDPYESPDNLSFYFVARISPLVRLGLRWWMILPLAIGGLFLSVKRRERLHFWIWILAPVFLAGAIVSVPLSRYRTSLAVFLIPLSSYFLVYLYGLFRHREFPKFIASSVALLTGWAVILGPLSRQPREAYERPAEYIYAAQIYHQHGDDQRALAILNWVHANFHKSPDSPR